MNAIPDQIRRQVLLRAPRERVWRAISDAQRFGAWFGVAFDGPFVEGARVIGRIEPTRVDADVAEMQRPFAGMPFEWLVERIEPMTRIVFGWHPYAIEPDIDYSAEPMTRIVFALDDAPGGILLTITESGFDGIPLARRAQAFEANAGGWALQAMLIGKYLASPESA